MFESIVGTTLEDPPLPLPGGGLLSSEKKTCHCERSEAISLWEHIDFATPTRLLRCARNDSPPENLTALPPGRGRGGYLYKLFLAYSSVFNIHDPTFSGSRNLAMIFIHGKYFGSGIIGSIKLSYGFDISLLTNFGEYDSNFFHGNIHQNDHLFKKK